MTRTKKGRKVGGSLFSIAIVDGAIVLRLVVDIVLYDAVRGSELGISATGRQQLISVAKNANILLS